MEIFDKKGCLIIPEPEKLSILAKQKGVVSEKKKILIRQLYCSEGHQLILNENPAFDDHAGIHLICEGNYFRQPVYLSPFQGDNRKKFKKDFERGEILRVYCPQCNIEFPKLTPHDCRKGAMYLALFLDRKADLNNAACVCNAWGCYASFLRITGDVLAEVGHQFLIR